MKQHRHKAFAASSLAAVLSASLAACATEPPALSVQGEVSMMTDLRSMIDAALADAAKRTGMQRGDLSVLSAEAVAWPDGSAGCPQPGMNYTQALVPGYRILIMAGTETLHYHAGRAGQPSFCPTDRAQDPAPYTSIR